jgi:hypothetical protein
MKKKLLACLEGKGRPGKKKPRHVPEKTSTRTSDTRTTFACFGAANKKPASRYLNFLALMQDSGRAVTVYDLDQLDTGLPPSPDLNSHRTHASICYAGPLRKLIAYKYIRKLQYGRKLKGKGRPYSLFIILPKGQESLKRFKGRYIKSVYYDDTLQRLKDEKECIFSRKKYVPRPLKVQPHGRFFSPRYKPLTEPGVTETVV